MDYFFVLLILFLMFLGIPSVVFFRIRNRQEAIKVEKTVARSSYCFNKEYLGLTHEENLVKLSNTFSPSVVADIDKKFGSETQI